MSSEEQAQAVKGAIREAREAVSRVVIGQETAIEMCLITIFSGGHALIEGVPGVGKTLLVRAIARAFGAASNRIQFTPDLMPSDITGTSVFNLKTREFDLVRGPVFSTFLLADEINRAQAKTQAALLQAMQERQVSIDGVTHELSRNFTVFATQNPIEFEGTYPLPEAQRDRFLMKVTMSYPDSDRESELLHLADQGREPDRDIAGLIPAPVMDEGRLEQVKARLKSIGITPELVQYITSLVTSTRKAPSILLGASPRAALSILYASKATAALRDRDFVTPDDIQSMFRPALEHRIVLRPEY